VGKTRDAGNHCLALLDTSTSLLTSACRGRLTSPVRGRSAVRHAARAAHIRAHTTRRVIPGTWEPLLTSARADATDGGFVITCAEQALIRE